MEQENHKHHHLHYTIPPLSPSPIFFFFFFFTISILITIVNSQNTLQPPLIPETLNFIDQRLAIVYPIIQTFKNTITSDPFNVTTTWVGPNICNYTGFFCDNPPDNLTAVAVASIDFNGFGLAAPSLAGFIDGLPDLALFHANSNSFSGSGPISDGIKNLKYLYELDLSNNLLNGPFPDAVVNMPNITFLDIRFNLFSGKVPPEIFMVMLDALFINDNGFVMQRLPEDLGDTTAFYLTLADNMFTGPIPRSIGKASERLLELLFLNNQLTGCLPYEIGFLRKLRLLDAGNNLLTGPLPWSLGCLEAVEQLNLAGNLLYGPVPEVVCALKNVVNLSLSDNYFTKIGPFCRKLIKRGILDVTNNCIYGYGIDRQTQRPLKECIKFYMHPSPCFHTTSFSFIPCKLPPWTKKKTTSYHDPRVSLMPHHRHLL